MIKVAALILEVCSQKNWSYDEENRGTYDRYQYSPIFDSGTNMRQIDIIIGKFQFIIFDTVINILKKEIFRRDKKKFLFQKPTLITFESGRFWRAIASLKPLKNFSWDVNGPLERAFLLCKDVFNMIIANDNIKHISIDCNQ